MGGLGGRLGTQVEFVEWSHPARGATIEKPWAAWKGGGANGTAASHAQVECNRMHVHHGEREMKASDLKKLRDRAPFRALQLYVDPWGQ